MPTPVRHIVMWKLDGDTAAERLAAARRVRSAFESLRGRIEGLRHIEIGIDVSAVDYACDVVLFSEFSDATALAAYANHPEHLRVRRELGDVRIARFQVDYPVCDDVAVSEAPSATVAAE